MNIDSRERLLRICLTNMQSKGLLAENYKERLKKEIQEIDSQAEHDYFLGLYDNKLKFSDNENNLFVPFVLGLCDNFDINKESSWIQGEFPDIDVDYLPIIQDYLRNDFCPKAFGRDNVVNIGNYGTFGIKSALLDMARVHGVDRNEIQSITKNLQDKDEEGNVLTWEKALEITPELQEYCKKYPEVALSAKSLINRNRSRGKHAGGTVISSVKIDDFVPVMIDTDGNPVSGWTEGLHDQDLQPVGLIKFDVLAIKDLLRISNCCKLIKERHGINSISANPGQSDWTDTSYLNDNKSISLANESKTRGVFQFDSEGMRNLIKSGGVDSFDDLVAYTALFRPGPLNLGMHERYIERKNLREIWDDQVPECIKNVLHKTHGVLCVHEDTFVSMYDGTEKKISEIAFGDVIHTLNESSEKFEPQKVKWAGFTKRDSGLKITLKNGFEIIVTNDHEILTYKGWQKAKDLEVKDLIAIPKKLEKKQSNSKPIANWLGTNENVSYLLGLLIGDGSISTACTVLSTGTKENHSKIKEYLVETFPNLFIKEYFHCRSWYLHITTKLLANDPKYGNRKTKFNVLLDKINIRSTCYNKRIPNLIMQSNKKTRMSFLAGLFDSDGTLIVKKEGVECVFTSVSKGLLQDVRKLLLLEGVQSHMAKNRLYVWNSHKLSILLNEYLVLKKIKGNLRFGKKNGKIPRSFLSEYILDQNLSKRAFEKKTGISRQHFKRNKSKNISLEVVKKIISKCNLLFVEIKNIEKINDQVFYDLSVENNHNFIANGIVVHNCYQEQVMQVLNIVGDIPLIHCEKIRKAISKKKTQEFIKYKEMFLQNGSKKTGWPIDSDDNKNIRFLWDQLESFASYGFNKCLSGDNLVYNESKKEFISIKQLHENFDKDKDNFLLKSYLDGKIVIDKIEDVFETGNQNVYDIEFTNGSIVSCTLNHKFLCNDNKFHSIEEIKNNNYGIIFEEG